MNISTKSLIHLFQRDSLVSQGIRYIPTNLCPYMRRFLRLVFASFIVYTVFVMLIFCTIFAPIAFWVGWESLNELFQIFSSIGAIIWAVAIITLTIWLMRNSSKCKTVTHKTGKTIHRFWNPISNWYHNNIFAQWYKAHHDQICPPITFKYED